MEQWVLPAVLAGVTLLFVAWAVLDGRRRARWLRRRVRDSFGAVPVDAGPGLATPRWYECAPGRGVRLDEQGQPNGRLQACVCQCSQEG